MSREVKEYQVNGNTYSVTPFNGREALKIKAILARMLGPFLGNALGGDPSKGIMDQSIDISKAVNALVDRLDENDVERLVMRLLAQTRRNGKEVGNSAVFDEVYAANLSELYQALWRVLEANYGDFLALAGDIGSRFAPVSPMADDSPVH